MHKPRIRSGGSLPTICAAYIMAALIFNIAPIFIGMLMGGLSLSESQAGLVVTVDMGAMAATGFLLGPFLSGTTRRVLLLTGFGILVAGNVLSIAVEQYPLLLVLRLITGFGAGLLFVYANTRISALPDQVRSYGIATVAASATGATLLFVLPMAIGQWGQGGLYGIVGILALIFAGRSLSESHEPLTTKVANIAQSANVVSKSNLALIALGTIAISLVQAAYYGFAERMGVDAGIDGETVGAFLALGYFGGIFSSALASWISTRWGRVGPLLVGVGLQAICSIAVALSIDATVILASIIGQSLGIFFAVPYLLGLSAEADDSGRFANVGVGLFFFSLAVGPLVGGIVIEAAGYAGIAWLVACGSVLGLAALLGPARTLTSQDRTPQY